MADTWQDAPLVFVPIACCPCGCSEYVRIRTNEREGDGSYSQKRVCKRCSKKYLAVFELPESGKDDEGGL